MYNEKLQEILKSKEYYAHLDDSGSQKEPLLSHLELTLKYYYKMNNYKNLELIIKNIVKSVQKDISEECVNKIYDMFLNAIHYHDIGKINPKFQIEKMNSKIEQEKHIINSNHSMLSAKIYMNIFEKEIIDTKNREFCIIPFFIYYFSYVISKHHSKLDTIEHFLDEIETLEVPKCCEAFIHKAPRKEILLKLKEQYKINEISIYILIKMLYSILISADYYATYEFMSGKEVVFKEKNQNLFKKYEESELFKIIKLYKNNELKLENVNKLRSDIFIETEENLNENINNSNIFYLEAPTGSGKTNTSINLAKQIYENCTNINSINYIFPFNTLIEQTQGVFENYFEINKDFIVVNNIAPIWDINDENVDYEKVYIDNLFRNYPITLTSHINLFNSLFGITKEENFSLVDYCNSVIILDEIQVYKNKIWREILIMLEKYAELLNIKIIIMSATLPNLDMLSIENDDVKSCNLINDIEKYYKNDIFKNRVQINYELLSQEITLEDLKSEVLKYKDQKVLVEFIKKQDSRDFYNMLKDEELIVFEITGDDNNYERKKVLNTIQQQDKVIVVCTQTIEAGVDIDMDIGFKDISFIDNEEQFLGRINRNNKKENCKAYFFNYTDAKKVYRGDRRIGYDLQDENLQKVLVEKNFSNYFNILLEKIKRISSKNNSDNINAFLKLCLDLKFKEIYNKLKLIDNVQDQIFLNFTYIVDGERIIGKEIWQEYCDLFYDKSISYAEKQIRLADLKKYMNMFIYNVNFCEKSKFCNDKALGILYIENGEEFIEDGKFNRKKYLEYSGGNFL